MAESRVELERLAYENSTVKPSPLVSNVRCWRVEFTLGAATIAAKSSASRRFLFKSRGALLVQSL